MAFTFPLLETGTPLPWAGASSLATLATATSLGLPNESRAGGRQQRAHCLPSRHLSVRAVMRYPDMNVGYGGCRLPGGPCTW